METEKCLHNKELGHTVIRFTNREVFNHCEAALKQIAEECERIVDGVTV